MGYKVKMQKIERPTNKTFYVNFPSSTEACDVEKGEVLEWFIEDRNIFVLKRVKKLNSLIGN
jgi:hypothetical protein